MDVSLLDTEYDAILVGTGMVEAILAGCVARVLVRRSLRSLSMSLTHAIDANCLQRARPRRPQGAASRPGATR